MATVRSALAGLSAITFLGFAACGPDFVPQDEIDRLRVLGVKSEVIGSDDRAWPGVLEDTRLSALVTNGRLEEPSSFEHRWRLCPVAFGSEADFECVFTESEFEDFLLESIPPEITDPLPLPPDAILDVDFDLGTSTTAVFNLRDAFFSDAVAELPDQSLVRAALEQALEVACEQLATAEFPDFVERPACDGTFDVRIDLTVCDLPAEDCTPDTRPSGDGGPPRVVQSLRFLDVIYDEELVPNPNRNPTIDVLCRSRDPVSDGATLGPDCGDSAPLVEMPAPPATDPEGLRFDESYAVVTLDVFVDPNGSFPLDAELFRTWDPDDERFTEEQQERLILSWFTTGGSPDRNRTAFDADEPETSNRSRAILNVWELPRRVDLDEPDRVFGIFVVVRDGRGGRAFVQRNARFVAEGEGSSP